MSKLTNLSKTLYVPLIGRITTSQYHDNILYDEKALELEKKIPSEAYLGKQSEYTVIASASRSVQIDRQIIQFLNVFDDGIIVELGVGLETSCYRYNISTNKWYGLDLKEVIDFRKDLLGDESKKIELISSSMFDEKWMNDLSDIKDKHVLFIASGVFHYFTCEDVVNLLKKLKEHFPHSFIYFDTLNHIGIKNIQHYMKQLGRADSKMYFYVDNANDLVKRISSTTKLIKERNMYKDIPRDGLGLATRFTMWGSDFLSIVKLIFIKL